MSAAATSSSGSTTNLSVLGFAEWYAKRQYPDVKKKDKDEKHGEAQRNALLNRNICVYNTAAAFQNSIALSVITTFALTALRILNPIAGLLLMAAGGFVHFMTDHEMAGTRNILDQIEGWVQEVKHKNGEKAEDWIPVSHQVLKWTSIYRLAPSVKTKTEDAEPEVDKDAERPVRHGARKQEGRVDSSSEYGGSIFSGGAFGGRERADKKDKLEEESR